MINKLYSALIGRAPETADPIKRAYNAVQLSEKATTIKNLLIPPRDAATETEAAAYARQSLVSSALCSAALETRFRDSILEGDPGNTYWDIPSGATTATLDTAKLPTMEKLHTLKVLLDADLLEILECADTKLDWMSAACAQILRGCRW